jgi:hypothetical protein
MLERSTRRVACLGLLDSFFLGVAPMMSKRKTSPSSFNIQVQLVTSETTFQNSNGFEKNHCANNQTVSAFNPSIQHLKMAIQRANSGRHRRTPEASNRQAIEPSYDKYDIHDNK